MPSSPPALADGAPSFAAFLGLDWGDSSHALALSDSASGQTESSTLEHSAENLHGWLDQLQARYGGRPVALAIEGTRGPIFPVLLERPWLHLWAVHPATSARYRAAFTPSGAKDDLPDAHVLLELLLRHRDKLTPLSLADRATRQLAGLCEARRDLVDRRTQLLLQLTACLKKYYPQALSLVGDNLASPLALDFLKKWPDLLTLKSARPATIKTFYYRHNVRRPEAVQARLDLIQQARALTTDEAIVQVAVRQCRVLVEQLHVVQRHVAQFDEAIAAQFRVHPEAALFRNLPEPGRCWLRGCSWPSGRSGTVIPTPTACKSMRAWPRCGRKAAAPCGRTGAGRRRRSCARASWSGRARPWSIATGPRRTTNR